MLAGFLRVGFRHIFSALGFPVIPGSLFVVHAGVRVDPDHPTAGRAWRDRTSLTRLIQRGILRKQRPDRFHRSLESPFLV